MIIKRKSRPGGCRSWMSPPEKAQALAEAAAKTDGILFHLWPMGAKIPTGEVMFPTAVSHQPVQQLEIPQ